MANDFQRVQPGQDVEIRASVWNEFIRAAEVTRSMSNSSERKSGTPKNASIVRVLNDSGGALDQWKAVGVKGVVCPPDSGDHAADESLEFFNNLVLKVRTPTTADIGRWMILLQPLQDQEIGLAVGIGVTQAIINITAVTDTHVDVVDGEDVPNSGPSGHDILWVAGGSGAADDTGEQLAVVRLGGGGGSADGFWVRITTYGSLSTGRYTYSGKKQEAYVAGMRDSTTDTATIYPIYNTVEINNDGSGVEGNSSDLTKYPSGTQVKPIQGSPVLWCRKDKDCYGATVYYVTYENGMPEGCSS